MGLWWHALAFVTHERAKMSHKPGRNVTQAGPKCHTRAKMSHSHVIIRVNSWPLEDFNEFYISNFQASSNDWWLRYFLWNCPQMNVTGLYISQHWFRCWFGAVRQQAITWTNVDSDLFCHMTSLGHKESTTCTCTIMLKNDEMQTCFIMFAHMFQHIAS